MRFSTRNIYYLRISSNAILPLYLYLDERHVDWMNETVLQHVLEDLRHRIPVKLASEPDGGTSNARKVAGPIDTHRGDTYQFGYFLQRTDPHAILIKTRNFFEAPKSTARNAQPPQASSSKKTGAQKKQQKRPVPKQRARKRKVDGASPPATITKKRKTKGKGKARARESDNEEDEVIAISSDDEDDEEIRMVEDTEPSPNGPVRRSARKGKQPAKGYIEIDDEDEDDGNEVPVLPDNSGTSAPEETTGTPTNQNADELDFDATELVAMDHTEPHEHDMTIVIKSEDQPEEPFLHASTPPATIRRDSDIPPSPAEPTPSPPPPIDLGSDDEEEDIKPKPILKLTYEGFNVNGKCLCVIVEPYPPLPAVRRQVSLAPVRVRAPRAPSIAPADFIPSAGPAQRARTPLFLPDWDDERERSQTPAPRRNLPRVPLFLDEPEDNEDDEELGGGMFALSQVLQTVGNNTALLAEDEDEMDGAVFFGDADEAREF